MAEPLSPGEAPLLVAAAPAPSLLAPLTDPAGGPALTRLRTFTAQAPVRKALPIFGLTAAIGLGALTWAALTPAPQRVLYSQLDDGERASVVDALDKAGIAYAIDNGTGTLTVDEDQLYRARMLVASDGALGAPESANSMLDNMPMGASRTLEGERLRAAREHELVLTIQEIDGVEAVRIHLAEGEKSVFVRENRPPTASVMLRLSRGRQLADSQVSAIVNLVAGSVPGLSPDAVRVVDQQGRLLSDRTRGDNDRLEIQARMEDKLRAQVSALLTPMLGEGNFSSEIQVELDMDQVTSARESYDKAGVLRSETQAQSQSTAPGAAVGVPGVLANTPPLAAVPQPGAPQGTPPAAAPAPGQSGPIAGESSATRTYELGREVAVANTTPGKLKRISVAVAISATAAKGGKADVDQIKQLVSAAVGADAARGDQVAVVSRSFDVAVLEGLPFYEAPWFAMAVRYGVGLLAVILVLLLGVRPLIKALSGGAANKAAKDKPAKDADLPADADAITEAMTDPATGTIDPELLGRQVSLAQRMVEERPQDALIALRQMLNAQTEPAR